jgi:hypothetical protein
MADDQNAQPGDAEYIEETEAGTTPPEAAASSGPPEEASARMLSEIQGLRLDVQKVEAGLSAVLGIEGIRDVLEHGFEQNADILKEFSGNFKRPTFTLTGVDAAALEDLRASLKRQEYRDMGPIPSAIKPTPNTTQFPAT